MSKKARQEEEEFSADKSTKVQEETANALKNLEDKTYSDENEQTQDEEESLDIVEENHDDIQAFEQTFMKPIEESKDVGSERVYPYKIDRFREISVNVKWSIGQQDFWIDITGDNDNLEVVINIDHPFFKPYSKQEDFKIVLEKLVLAFVIAEKEAELSSDKDGYVLPSTIRHRINDILSKMSKE